MAIQVRSFGSFSNMQSQMTLQDWHDEADAAFDAMPEDIFVAVATNIIIQYEKESEEHLAMIRQVARKGLEETIKSSIQEEMEMRERVQDHEKIWA